MIDIKYIRDNPEKVEQRSREKGYAVNIAGLLELDDRRRVLQGQVDQLRRQRNAINQSKKGIKPNEEVQSRGRQFKKQLAGLEEQLRELDHSFLVALRSVPNMPLDDVPVGQSEDENVIVKTIGNPREFTFQPKAHHQIGEKRDLIDKARAVKISGSRFTYLKGDLVRLQFAIVSYVINQLSSADFLANIIAYKGLDLSSKPFIPVLPPALLRTEPYQASSRLNAEEVTYKIEQDDLWLNASAEHSLCTMYMNEIISESALPIRMLGYSTSFRREAGTYGQDMEGILRLHQFDKLEMEVLSTPETGLEEHKLVVAIQEHLVGALGLPYQVLEKCTADIGKPNAKGVDINTWFPSQHVYRETHTADYMTDYQTRDLRIRLKKTNGELVLVHTNDATAFALGRIMAAVIENYQTEDGHITIPRPLRTYFNGQEQI